MAGHSNEDDERERPDAQVPVAYAEKAMSSLLRLHDDLVEEKERRIDLYRRLMDREQQLAEIRAYVQLLESELGRQGALPAGTGGFLPPGPGEWEQRARGLAAHGTQAAAHAGSATEAARAVAGTSEVQATATAAAANVAVGAGAGWVPSSAVAAATEDESAHASPPPAGGALGPAPVVAWIPANSAKGGGR